MRRAAGPATPPLTTVPDSYWFTQLPYHNTLLQPREQSPRSDGARGIKCKAIPKAMLKNSFKVKEEII
jgi:hypothetical protein